MVLLNSSMKRKRWYLFLEDLLHANIPMDLTFPSSADESLAGDNGL